MPKKSIKPTSPLSEIASSSPTFEAMAPPPYPEALESYLNEMKSRHSSSEKRHKSAKHTRKDNSCYKLPAKDLQDAHDPSKNRKADLYSPISIRAREKHSESPADNSDLIHHQKKLAALRSSAREETVEEGESDENDAEPTFKVKSEVVQGMKRSRSMSNLDSSDDSESFTQKKLSHKNTGSAGISESPSNDRHLHRKSLSKSPSTDRHRHRKSLSRSPSTDRHCHRKSLPETPSTDHHHHRKSLSKSPSTDRHRHRKSLPAETSSSITPGRKDLPSPFSVARYKSDQTPYASPLYPPSKRLRPTYFLYDDSELQTMESDWGFVDSHCHLDFLFDRQGYRGTYAEYRKENRFPKCYKGCLAIFCNPHSFSRSYKWKHFLEDANVWAAFGCHPHNAGDYDDDVERSLCDALEHSKVRALGEIGLDYSNRNNCMKEKQFDAFRRQLRIALRKKLPVVIHCREAHKDAINIVKEILPLDYLIHLHCFTDTWDACEMWLSVFPNLCVGLTNVLSFPSAVGVREVATQLPLDRLLLETDTPYFVPRAPTVERGTRHSHPGMAIHVAAQVAALKNTSLESVLRATRTNTKRIYNI